MGMQHLNGMNVLMLTPNFFGYEDEIKKEIESRGATVYYNTCNPTPQTRTFIGVLKKYHIPHKWIVRRFEDKLYSRFKYLKFDYIIIICGWAITSRLTHRLRERNLSDGGKMILYYWDSMKRLKDDKKRWDDFDSIYTFDPMDHAENPDHVNFLPLFYCKKYWDKSIAHISSDALTIGTFRLDRLDFVRKIKSQNPSLVIKSYLYTPIWEIKFHKLFRKKYKNIRYSELNYKKLTFKEVVEMYKSSRAVIDIPAVYQYGLTIRTFETLAMHKKLITSNTTIKQYDFYNKNDIFIISDDCRLPSQEWFDEPFSISDDVIKKYDLNTWVSTLFKS